MKGKVGASVEVEGPLILTQEPLSSAVKYSIPPPLLNPLSPLLASLRP